MALGPAIGSSAAQTLRVSSGIRRLRHRRASDAQLPAGASRARRDRAAAEGQRRAELDHDAASPFGAEGTSNGRRAAAEPRSAWPQTTVEQRHGRLAGRRQYRAGPRPPVTTERLSAWRLHLSDSRSWRSRRGSLTPAKLDITALAKSAPTCIAESTSGARPADRHGGETSTIDNQLDRCRAARTGHRGLRARPRQSHSGRGMATKWSIELPFTPDPGATSRPATCRTRRAARSAAGWPVEAMQLTVWTYEGPPARRRDARRHRHADVHYALHPRRRATPTPTSCSR